MSAQGGFLICGWRNYVSLTVLVAVVVLPPMPADAEPSEAAQELGRMWNERKEEMAGWQDERKGAAWNQYLSGQPNDAEKLLMPKTVEAVVQMSLWFTLDTVKEAGEQNKNDADVKSILAEAHKTFDTAAAKLNEAFNDMLSEAEKDEVHYKDNVADARVDALRLAADHWFEGTPYHDRNMARARKLTEKWKSKREQSEQAREALLAKQTADASAKWPAIAASIKEAQEGFTPDQADAWKGKTIHLKGSNRLGSDFNPGDYDYAHEINGMCVAGKFTAGLSKEVDEVTRQTGHDLPGSDWDLYAVVEGRGQVSRRTRATGTVTAAGGQNVGSFTAEGHELVPCVVIRIFAVHAGPVAAATSSEASRQP
jgi:hypothetical protein